MTNILLVEDDRVIIENLSAVLKAEGFQVRAEAGQREALEALQEEKFDLLLLDVSLQNGRVRSVLGGEGRVGYAGDLSDGFRGRVQRGDRA